jgi:hypothetical protein
MRSLVSALGGVAVALALAGCGGGGGGGGGHHHGGAAAGSTGGGSPGTSSGGGVAPGKVLMAGAAAVDLAPPPGTPLAGFGGPPRREWSLTTIPSFFFAAAGNCVDFDPSDPATFFRPSRGTIDPVMVRALVISNGARKIALLKFDTIGVTGRLRSDLAALAATLGIAQEDFLICATHTHSGPGALSERRLWQLIAVDCLDDTVYQKVLAAATDALRRADASLRPAEVGTGSMLEYNASENRRGRPGIYDPELGLLKVVEPSGAPIAALIDFAVHGTCFGADNMYFSADCMGAIERTVEAGLGGGVAIFVNGAEGDVAPSQGGQAGIQALGRILGGDVLGLWPQVRTKPWVRIESAFAMVPMPPPVLNVGCLPLPGTNDTICDAIPGFALTIPLDAISDWIPDALPFQAFRIDDTVFASVPGEPITEIGWEIKARAKQKGFQHAFIVGLANEYGGYMTTLAEYMRGEYEGKSTIYGPSTGQLVVDAADAMVDLVK